MCSKITKAEIKKLKKTRKILVVCSSYNLPFFGVYYQMIQNFGVDNKYQGLSRLL